MHIVSVQHNALARMHPQVDRQRVRVVPGRVVPTQVVDDDDDDVGRGPAGLLGISGHTNTFLADISDKVQAGTKIKVLRMF